MENTPLELYETAYRLHYIENRLPEAISYYEALIKEFPDSNECGYAVIQIQKIKSNELAKILKKRQSNLHPVAVIGFIFSLLSVIAITSGFFYFRYMNSLQKQYLSCTERALSKMAVGQYDEALKLLTEAKVINKKELAPFDIAATIYRKMKQFNTAKAEYEIYYRLNPETPMIDVDVSAIQDQNAPPVLVQNVNGSDSVNTPTVSKPSITELRPIQSRFNEKTPRQSKLIKHSIDSNLKAAPVKPKVKPVNPDSVSYF